MGLGGGQGGWGGDADAGIGVETKVSGGQDCGGV